MTLANQSWPESKTSSSGLTPSSWKRFAPVAEHVGGGDVERAAVAEVVRAAVQGRDVGQQLLDVGQPVQGVDQVGALDGLERVLPVDDEVTAHPRGEVEDDVDAAVADESHGLAVEGDVARADAGLGVAYVDVDDRGPGTRRGDARRRRSGPG